MLSFFCCLFVFFKLNLISCPDPCDQQFIVFDHNIKKKLDLGAFETSGIRRSVPGSLYRLGLYSFEQAIVLVQKSRRKKKDFSAARDPHPPPLSSSPCNLTFHLLVFWLLFNFIYFPGTRFNCPI